MRTLESHSITHKLPDFSSYKFPWTVTLSNTSHLNWAIYYTLCAYLTFEESSNSAIHWYYLFCAEDHEYEYISLNSTIPLQF